MVDEKFVFTTKVVEKIREKFDDGYPVKRHEKYWFTNLPMVKKAGLVFSFSDDELLEYSKCKFGIDEDDFPFIDSETQVLKQSGIQYFSERHCMIKNEVGKIGNMRLRNYQNEILDLYTNNRFSILCGSRQIGKCFSFNETVEILGKDIPVYEIWYETLDKKTLLDKIKYRLYKIYNKL